MIVGLKFQADCYMLIYTPTVRSWLNLWGVMAASLLPFMMKVMVSVSLEVLSLVILVLVLLALTQW
jgi:hypothetical protein